MKMKIAAFAAALLTVLTATAPAMAQGSRQKDKNLMRNLGIGLGSAAAYKTLKGDWKTGLLLGAGAAYSGKKYEDARKAQSRENGRTSRIYRYKDGKRVGYYNYRDGRRVGSYQRLSVR